MSELSWTELARPQNGRNVTPEKRSLMIEWARKSVSK